MNTTSRRWRIGAAAVALTAGLAGCGGQQHSTAGATGGRLTIATGNTTGVYYILGGGLAKLVSTDLDGYKATAEATKASKENVERVVAGQNDVAFCLADTVEDAVRGQHSFAAKQPVKALLRIYRNTTQVLVRRDSGITRIADMRGKSVSTGSPNSGTELIATRLLAANQLTPADINQKKASLPETVEGVKDGSIQALFWSGGLPTAGVKDLFASLGDKVRFLDLSAELPRLRTSYGEAYQDVTIAPTVYGTPTAVNSIAVPNLLVVRADMPDQLAYKLVKLIFAHRDDLVKVHPEAKNISLDTAAKTGEIPLHPGARKALTELGASS
jgi:TRAP transporter TAXI family solute receptor